MLEYFEEIMFQKSESSNSLYWKLVYSHESVMPFYQGNSDAEGFCNDSYILPNFTPSICTLWPVFMLEIHTGGMIWDYMPSNHAPNLDCYGIPVYDCKSVLSNSRCQGCKLRRILYCMTWEWQARVGEISDSRKMCMFDHDYQDRQALEHYCSLCHSSVTMSATACVGCLPQWSSVTQHIFIFLYMGT